VDDIGEDRDLHADPSHLALHGAQLTGGAVDEYAPPA
jgi:hypothetical protein